MEAAISQENDVNHPDSDEPGIGEEMNTESSESPDEELTNNTMQIIYRNTAAGSNYRSPMNQAKTLMIAFDSAARHLGSCPPFKVQSTFQGVSRAFLTRVFGCDPKALFAPMCKGSWAGRPVILPNWDFHPFLPGAPGLPGLILSLRNEFFEHPLCSLFIRVTKKPVTWAYYGQYKFVVSGVFSTTDFINQKSTVKEAQADAIMTCPPFHDIRARIYLRKSGMPVTASAVELETQRIKDNDGGKVTHNDVINALSHGEESISIITMSCIDFDHRFADRIEREWNSR
ncbi:hypothetical protein BJ138DRAFT_759187 [Hygrophoropsis aurantiaca]|uniref:Uncharacterized protein n=1 Tax=Hygrophoropsis aurantiaca TaxID=72124 RepID=A0ACB7ZYN4_9AGAM|nr:hypothetical protein BJ138DRAFT_759187 [Hygrophoropsis aurantiaca]